MIISRGLTSLVCLEARLKWFVLMQRKDSGYIGQRVFNLELPGRNKIGKPQKKLMDVVNEDMQRVSVTGGC